jgi:hypothetical protein
VQELLWKRGDKRKPKKIIAMIRVVLRYSIIGAGVDDSGDKHTPADNR